MANWISNFTTETDLSAKHIRPLENAQDLDPLLDRIGFGLAGLALLGVLIHAALRILSHRRRSH